MQIIMNFLRFVSSSTFNMWTLLKGAAIALKKSGNNDGEQVLVDIPWDV